MYLDDAIVFSTETMQVRPVYEGDFAFKNPGHTAIQADNDCVFALVEDENSECHVVQIKKEAGSADKFTLTNTPITEASNARTEIPPYDSNYVLKKKGMKELNEGQMESYDHWWKLYSELYWSCEPDQTVENMNIAASRTDIKVLFHEFD